MTGQVDGVAEDGKVRHLGADHPSDTAARVDAHPHLHLVVSHVVHFEAVDLPHQSESHVGDLLGVLFAIWVGEPAGYQVAVTNNLNLVDVKHVNGIVEYVVKVVQKLDRLPCSAHSCQLCEAHDVTEEDCCAVIQPEGMRGLKIEIKSLIFSTLAMVVPQPSAEQ